MCACSSGSDEKFCGLTRSSWQAGPSGVHAEAAVQRPLMQDTPRGCAAWAVRTFIIRYSPEVTGGHLHHTSCITVPGAWRACSCVCATAAAQASQALGCQRCPTGPEVPDLIAQHPWAALAHGAVAGAVRGALGGIAVRAADVQRGHPGIEVRLHKKGCAAAAAFDFTGGCSSTWRASSACTGSFRAAFLGAGRMLGPSGSAALLPQAASCHAGSVQAGRPLSTARPSRVAAALSTTQASTQCWPGLLQGRSCCCWPC